VQFEGHEATAPTKQSHAYVTCLSTSDKEPAMLCWRSHVTCVANSTGCGGKLCALQEKQD
jgi:hypothetical protein